MSYSYFRSKLGADQAIQNSHDESTQSLVTKPIDSLIAGAWDYAALVVTSSTIDTWTFKSGGSGGTTVCTIAITYTDSGHGTISTISRT